LVIGALLSVPAFATGASYRVCVTNEGSGDLSVIDGTNNTVIGRWPLGKRPRGIAAAADGKQLYVALSGSPLAGPGIHESRLPPADKTADGIGVIDLSSDRLHRVLSGIFDPEQLAVSRDGTRLYVACEDTGKAVIMHIPDGRILGEVSVGGEPEGVAVSERAGLIGFNVGDG
jgi:YVTN family beta-propeller protein